MPAPHDVAIIGAGPAGLSLALSLAQQGRSVALVERLPAATLAAPPYDGREIALTQGSASLLRTLGAWDKLSEADIAPLGEAVVLNGPSTRALRFHAAGTQLGHLVPNHRIRQTLFEAAAAQPNIHLIANTAATDIATTADTASVEVTTDTARGPGRTLVDLNGHSGATALVGPGDAVRVAGRFLALEPRGVVIEGEVVRPGSYDVLHGETLSSLIARAGGLTREAYPAGAVFTRESARRREGEQFQRQAQDIERALTSELFRPNNTTRPEGVAMARQLANELRGQAGIGRITVEADPAALRARPGLDILLEPGDRLVVPKRSLTVAVFGEVQAPATLQYDPARRAEDYLAQAGGVTRNADEDRLFVLLPNGSSRPLSTSAWNFSDATIPPGSTIVVPRDPHPFDFLEAARDIGGALGQLALTAASIAVIQRQ